MAKLSQIIAVEKTTKSRIYAAVSELHKLLQKPALFNGFVKTYKLLVEGGKELPPEKQKVQYSAKSILDAVRGLSSEYFRVVARKDWTNGAAKATIFVGKNPLLTEVPVTYLLFLEKQLNYIRTMVAVIPVLDDAEDWSYDTNAGHQKTAEVQTHRTEKQQRPIVLYDATPDHPAQTQLITEDVLAGYWTLTKHSGAMPKPEKQAILDRVDKLIVAVKEARESANSIEEVSSPDVGAVVFDYLFNQSIGT